MDGDWKSGGVLLQELISFYWFIILRQNVQLASVVLQPWVIIRLFWSDPLILVLQQHPFHQVHRCKRNVLSVLLFEEDLSQFVLSEDLFSPFAMIWNTTTKSLNVKWVW